MQLRQQLSRTHRFIAGLVAAFALLQANHALGQDESISLKRMGSFHTGGRLVELSGKQTKQMTFTPGGASVTVDPNGTFQVEQMYTQYFVPAPERGAVPILMWHGGGLTGVTYESTPDGREGWLTYFLRKGWAVYNSDAVERGRSGWAQYPEIFAGDPVFLNTANPFERFRIGQGPGSWNDDPVKRRPYPTTQFPIEAYENFMRQVVPRWLSTDEAILSAYRQLVDRICPCVILFHSQGGQFGFKVAQEKPEKVKALVAIEPATVGYFEKAAALKDIPTLMVFGDFIAEDPRWTRMRATAGRFADSIKSNAGQVDIIDLPKMGIVGNSHMLMMDKNNRQVADLIQKWLTEQGLYK
jgi:pimeloyl-ACP methyl ester carboxylesterase